MSVRTTIPQRYFVASDYSRILHARNLKFKGEQYYFTHGTVKNNSVWVLNISVIKDQATEMLNIVVPELLKYKVPFKIARDIRVVEQLLSGSLGSQRTGKIIVVYVENENNLKNLAKRLIEITSGFRGPAIPTDAHLGANVYTNYAQNGEQTEYAIPFKLPAGIRWPFAEIRAVPEASSIFLKDAYLIRKVLKNDLKGRVIRALRVVGISIKTVIIKEGRHDMFIDDYGRDIQERIRWQSQLLIELEGKVPVPKHIELFNENGNIYLAMESVEGEALHNKVSDIYQDRTWRHLQCQHKVLLVKYLLQLLGIVKKLHEQGYIHRDLSPANFLVHGSKMAIIDFEIAYNYVNATPTPAFTSGINGYTAPERALRTTPAIPEDVYSIGAIMIMIFTNLQPARGFDENLQHQRQNLMFQIEHKAITDIIIQCLQNDPAQRPTINEIIQQIDLYLTDLNTSKQTSSIDNYHPTVPTNDVISKSLDGLIGEKMLNEQGLWHSNVRETNEEILNDQNNLTVYPGLYTGVAGVVYSLGVVKNNGISTKKTEIAVGTACRYLIRQLNDLSSTDTSLYTGTAGIALALSSAIQNGLIQPSAQVQAAIKRCFTTLPDEFCIETGLAGTGMALLNCLATREDTKLLTSLEQCVNQLLRAQKRSGEWSVGSETFTGYSKGVAGIATFLFLHYRKYPTSHTLNAATKALDWLLKEKFTKKGCPLWFVSNKVKKANPWLEDGFTGVALAFATGYSVTNDSKYKKTAERSLNFHQPKIASNYIDFGNGISGLAQVYLEIQKYSQDTAWRDRASWIVDLLSHSTYSEKNGALYWATENRRPPTADFGIGNAGIIHLLTRANNYETTAFPFFPKYNLI